MPDAARVVSDAPHMRIIYSGIPAYLNAAVTVAAAIGLIFTLRILFRRATKRRTKLWLLILWTLLPPLWFSAEYYYLYKPFAPAGAFELFKYGQEVASKIWAAIVALIAAVLFTKFEDK